MEGWEERKVLQLPWHLSQAEEFVELGKTISDLRVFDKLYSPNNKFDLFRYWRQIIKETNMSIVEAYTDALKHTDQYPRYARFFMKIERTHEY